jgi:TRAP-type transport system periplasmic protein
MPGEGLSTFANAVKKLSNNDLKALRIRTYDSVSQAELQPLKTVAMNVSFADVMPMLKDGRANGVLSSGEVINAALYELLSAELKQVIDLAAAQTEAEQWQRIAGIERAKLLLR